jgi:hypothetical protein
MRLDDSDAALEFLAHQIVAYRIPLIKMPMTKISINPTQHKITVAPLLKTKSGSIWVMTMMGNIVSQKLSQSQPVEILLNNDVDSHREDSILQVTRAVAQLQKCQGHEKGN